MDMLMRDIVEKTARFRKENTDVGELISYELTELTLSCKLGIQYTFMSDLFDEYEEEEKKKKKKQEQDAIMASVIDQLNEIKKAGMNSPLPADRRAAQMADEILRSPQMLRAMEEKEMREAVKMVEQQRLGKEDELADSVAKEAENAVPSSEDMVRGDDGTKDPFEQAKEDLTDYAAKMLAVKTLSRTVKSYIVADKDLSKDEEEELTEDMLSTESISACTKDIKGRDDFKRMMSGVNNWAELKTMKQEIVEGGNKLFDRLAKTSKEMIREETDRLTVEQVQAEVEAYQRQQGRVLRPDQQDN